MGREFEKIIYILVISRSKRLGEKRTRTCTFDRTQGIIGNLPDEMALRTRDFQDNHLQWWKLATTKGNAGSLDPVKLHRREKRGVRMYAPPYAYLHTLVLPLLLPRALTPTLGEYYSNVKHKWVSDRLPPLPTLELDSCNHCVRP